jgi:predicted amidohydrolase
MNSSIFSQRAFLVSSCLRGELFFALSLFRVVAFSIRQLGCSVSGCPQRGMMGGTPAYAAERKGIMSILLETTTPASAALTLDSVEPWAPHPTAAPNTRREEQLLTIAANGTRTCCGGWQCRFDGVKPGAAYRIAVDVAHTGLAVPRDSLECLAYWGDISADQSRPSGLWEYLLPEPIGGDSLRFSRTLIAPAEAGSLTLRYTFRWSPTGSSQWRLPVIERLDRPEQPPAPVKVAVVTGEMPSRRSSPSLRDNLEFYSRLCEAACARRPQLVVLPEIALQWRTPGHLLDLAVPAPGPETDVFAAISRRHRVRILLGLLERDGDAVYNSAVLISPDGIIDGRYHKIHLAVGGESSSGILPGDGFPVFATEIGAIGCNICMDSSAAESSRMIGLNGADFLLLPIMGDHRASRWSPGRPNFHEGRWKAIMRTRAMDNQLCLVVARNETHGSCIVDRKGDLLAWNDGDADFIEATVPLDDGYRTWNGGCFRAVNWMQRRPHLYGEFTEQNNQGSLR